MTTPALTAYDDVTPCRGTCGRLLRPDQIRAAERPGTVPHRARGYCKGCLRQAPAEERPPARFQVPPHCAGCGHPLRPTKAKIAEHPGTLRHVAGGFCKRCYVTPAEREIDAEGIRPDFDETRARRDLDRWLAARSRRLADVHHLPAFTPNTETERIAA